MLLRVKAMPFWFLVRGKFFHRPVGVCSETKGESESEIKSNDPNYHGMGGITDVIFYLVLWS